MYLNNMINRLERALLFLLVSWSAMLTEKQGVALMESTLSDVEHYDWLIDIPFNTCEWSQMTVVIDLDILE